MEAFLVRYLIVTGVGALIVLSAPSIVIIGFLFLFLPGLVLSLLPTAFLYGAVFAAIWWPAKMIVGEWPAVLVAAAGTIALLWAIPTFANRTIDARIAEHRRDDRDDGARLPLRGVVRIARDRWEHVDSASPEGRAWAEAARARSAPDPGGAPPRPIACDGLCAAFLFTPGVEAVILAPERRGPAPAAVPPAPVLFRIDRTPGCTSVVDVGSQWVGIGDLPREWQQLRDGWRTRMAAGECIVPAEPEGAADLAIVLTEAFNEGGGAWSLTDPRRRATRLEIADRDGVRLRRTMVSTGRLAVPLRVGWRGTASTASFGWERTWLADGREAGFFRPLALLAERLGLDLAPDAAATALAARRQLAALLDDPDRPADDPGFALPEAVLRDIGEHGAKPGDAALIVRIAADPRTRELGRLAQAIGRIGPDAARLRQPIVSRLLRAPAGDEAAATAGRALARLPAGLFATAMPEELALLGDPARRESATGLIRRQADRGADAAPMLLDMLADVFRRRGEEPGRSGPDRERDTEVAIRHALAMLGPGIAGHRPRLEAILDAQTTRKGRVKTWHWEVTLIRMGAAPESFENPSWHGGDAAEYHRLLRREVERFARDVAAGREADAG